MLQAKHAHGDWPPRGHGEQNVPLPIGARAVLDTRRMSLEFIEPFVTCDPFARGTGWPRKESF